MSSFKNYLFNSKDFTRKDLAQNSYGTILTNKALFKRSGGRTDDLSRTDNPDVKFFKLFFYFENPGEDGDRMASNLLSLNWSQTMTNLKKLPWEAAENESIEIDPIEYSDDQIKMATRPDESNTALNYLLLNNEWERAEKLTQFIKLLSNISTYSPWYFSEVEGVAEAMNRENSVGKTLAFEDQRQSITINCLQDAFDDRIGTLIDLYRDIVWSHIQSKEILPANLRKFDMGLYIFSAPVSNIHAKKEYNAIDGHNSSVEQKFAKFDNSASSDYRTSAKYIEFQNCEIDYNTVISGYETLSNKDGIRHNYKIKIFFDKCMESRYNEFIVREIGDFIMNDTYFGEDISYQSDTADARGAMEELEKRLKMYDNESGAMEKLESRESKLNAHDTEEVSANNTHSINSPLIKLIDGKIKHIVLGNMHNLDPLKFVRRFDIVKEGQNYITKSIKQHERASLIGKNFADYGQVTTNTNKYTKDYTGGMNSRLNKRFVDNNASTSRRPSRTLPSTLDDNGWKKKQ